MPIKIFIKTFGCQSNIADSEQLAGLLNKKGYKLVETIKEADIIILQSCSVKLTTQNREIGFIKKLPKNKKLIVGGCLTKILDLKKFSNNIIAVYDTNSILKVPEIIKNKKDLFSEKKEKRISLLRLRKNKDIGIINISQGCINNCSYCSTKLARGNLKSYKINDIKKELKSALKQGCKKIYLTGQDTGCYGFDINTSLPELLKEVIKIKDDFKIRVGMMNPEHAKLILKELISVYKLKKIIKFLHIPVQSGSDKVLKDMKRNYRVKDFKDIVNKFRKEIPNINISTDIICGFPTETEEDFKKTIKLIEEIKPEVLNISKFGPRPKTLASKLKPLTSQTIKKRSSLLTKIFKKQKYLKK